MKKRVKFMITAFRDGFQSAYGARVFTRDFLPAVEAAVEAGLTHFEAGGGALTANTQMMRDNDTLDRFEDVIMQMGEVVARGGFGTSVTPVSQFYFQQAFNNVFFGPWKSIAEGYGKMVLGYFGRTPVEPDPEIVKLAQDQLKLEPTTEIPVDINDRDSSKGIEAAKKLLQEAALPVDDENIFIAATCKEKGIQFLKGEAKIGVRKSGAASPENSPEKTVAAMQESKDPPEERFITVEAYAPGHFVRSLVEPGESVTEGDVLVVIELMNMEEDIVAPLSGVIYSILPPLPGQSIRPGDPLVVIKS